MPRKRREGAERGLYHIFQRTVDKHLLFRCLRDHLVYHTLFYEELLGKKVLSIGKCHMSNHIHLLLYSRQLSDLVDFMKNFNFRYARAYNTFHERSGKLFEKSFGSALEVTNKEKLNSIAYVYNNPVPAGYCSRAELYRWNLLPYAASNYPCSSPIVKSKHNYRFNQAIKLVDAIHNEGKHLNYQILTNLFESLGLYDTVCWGYKDPGYKCVIGSGNLSDIKSKYQSSLTLEQEQFLDYIISLYNCVDYQRLIKFYGSLEKMIYAFSVTTGSEFGLKEDTFI